MPDTPKLSTNRKSGQNKRQFRRMIKVRNKVLSLIFSAIFGAASLTVSSAGTAVADSHKTAFDDPERKAIESIVTDYLLENPEIILRALQVLEERKQAAKAAQEKSALAANRDALEQDPNSPVAGNPKGDVTVVEFFDYRCPYCKRVGPVVQRLRKEDANIRVVYKEWPILGPASVFAAKAVLAAREQEKYVEFHEKVMASRNVTETSVLNAAKELGLDLDKLRADMEIPQVKNHIEQTMELARALGINGTPAFVIGDRLIPGAADFATLSKAIADARDGQQTSN